MAWCDRVESYTAGCNSKPVLIVDRSARAPSTSGADRGQDGPARYSWPERGEGLSVYQSAHPSARCVLRCLQILDRAHLGVVAAAVVAAAVAAAAVAVAAVAVAVAAAAVEVVAAAVEAGKFHSNRFLHNFSGDRVDWIERNIWRGLIWAG
eukprot:COSAG02_NODE_3142_length_7292_cov_31.970944_4_plen_151_part_00